MRVRVHCLLACQNVEGGQIASGDQPPRGGYAQTRGSLAPSGKTRRCPGVSKSSTSTYALFTAAAAVYNATGSLNKAASLLWWAGFWSDEEELRAWIEDNQEHIIAHADKGSARTVAGLSAYSP